MARFRRRAARGKSQLSIGAAFTKISPSSELFQLFCPTIASRGLYLIAAIPCGLDGISFTVALY